MANQEVLNGSERYKKSLWFCLIGMLINLVLGGAKVFVGYESGFVSIMGDGFNNITDVGDVVLLAMTFYYAAKPSDAEHPFGLGRLEYINASVISAIIIYVGITLFIKSIDQIRLPQNTEFTWITAGILIFSMIIKCFLAWFYERAGKKLNSDAFYAYGKDSLSDLFATAGILIAAFIEQNTGYHIDGIVGVIVSLLILYTGYEILKKSVNHMLGTISDEALYQDVKAEVLSIPGVYGVHDVIIHDYGPGRHFATVHIEVDSKLSFMDSHAITEKVTTQLRDKFDLQVVVHADPILLYEPKEKEYRRDLESAIYQSKLPVSYHDFFAVKKGDKIYFSFELTLEGKSEKTDKEIYEIISEKMKNINPTYHVKLLVDRHFISGKIYGK